MKNSNSSPKANTRSLRADESPDGVKAQAPASAAPVGTKRSAVRPVPRGGLSRDEAANKAMAIYQVIAQVGIAPRLLTRAQAAVYCGVSLPTFMGICPVRTIALGASKRLERYDLRDLEQWIDTFSGDKASCGRDWLATLDAKDDGGSREGA